MECMKFVIIFLFSLFLCPNIFAAYLSAENVEVDIYSNINSFRQQADCINADSYTDYYGATLLKYGTDLSVDEIICYPSFLTYSAMNLIRILL